MGCKTLTSTKIPFKKKEFTPCNNKSQTKCKTGGIYVYLWLMHVDVWQKPIQYCKTAMLQLKINKFFKKHKTHTSSKYLREYGRKFRKVTVG